VTKRLTPEEVGERPVQRRGQSGLDFIAEILCAGLARVAEHEALRRRAERTKEPA